MSETRIGVAVVTHNAGRWLRECLHSISSQSRAPDHIVVVDDRSTDDTLALLERAQSQGLNLEVQPSHATSADIRDRIAANFFQAARSLQDCDVVALGDHDDVWQRHRLEHQSNMMHGKPNVLMLASDGRVIHEFGRPTEQRLRTLFAVPGEFPMWSAAAQLRWTLRRSVAVGGASMIRPWAVTKPPQGWLHDRWWSIEAASKAGFLVDDEVVIDYRQHQQQQVGGHQGRQHLSGVSRANAIGEGDVRRLRDVHELRKTCASECRSELTYARLVRTLASRP